MKNKYRKFGTVVLLLAVIILCGYFLVRKKEKPIELLTERPSYGYIAESVTATGKIQPEDTVTVGTQVSGIIKDLYVDYNSRVKKGQLLARLDKSLLRAALDQNRGNLQNAQSQLLYETKNFNRQNQLYKANMISRADYDIALNTYSLAKAALATVEAQVRAAAKNLSYTDIYSPISGVVLNRNINVGQTVAASFNTPTLFIIARDITKMEVNAAVDEADIGDVQPGNRATFTVDAFMNDEFLGTVKEIRLHPAVSANVVTYATIINAPNKDLKLKPGMTANITIYTKEIKRALLIPAGALSFRPDSSLLQQYEVIEDTIKNRAKESREKSVQHAFVWLLYGKKLVKTPVVTGITDNIKVQVIKGLKRNDLVVTGQKATTSTRGPAAGSPFIPRRTGGGRGR